MLNYIYKETILPIDLVLKPFNSSKDYSFIFIYKYKSKELTIIFILNC
jgi:hypothetical protein